MWAISMVLKTTLKIFFLVIIFIFCFSLFISEVYTQI